MMLILLVCYFIPAIVASCRHHNATGAIIVLNIVLGWTFIGWVIALVWASTNDLRKEPRELRAEPRAWVRRTLPGGSQRPTDGGTLDRPATLRFTELREARLRPALDVEGAQRRTRYDKPRRPRSRHRSRLWRGLRFRLDVRPPLNPLHARGETIAL